MFPAFLLLIPAFVLGQFQVDLLLFFRQGSARKFFARALRAIAAPRIPTRFLLRAAVMLLLHHVDGELVVPRLRTYTSKTMVAATEATTAAATTKGATVDTRRPCGDGYKRVNRWCHTTAQRRMRRGSRTPARARSLAQSSCGARSHGRAPPEPKWLVFKQNRPRKKERGGRGGTTAKRVNRCSANGRRSSERINRYQMWTPQSE